MAATKAMTHQEAHALVKEWQQQLATAQSAQASFDLGQYALTNGLEKAIQQKTRLETELSRCQAGVAVAEAQEKETHRNEQLAWAEAEEEEIAELDAQAAVVVGRIRELDAELTPLNEQLRYIAFRVDSLKDHVSNLRRVYGEKS